MRANIMSISSETPSFNLQETDVSAKKSNSLHPADITKERVKAKTESMADNLAAARRLHNFPNRSFLADFLRLRQADGLVGSYAFIVKA